MELRELKINSINIENFKNVRQGEIDLTFKETPLNIVGIYGQNGSGKTTVIEAINVISKLIDSENLTDDIFDMLELDTDAQAKAVFTINEKYIITYTVKLVKRLEISEGELGSKALKTFIDILSESLTTKIIRKDIQPKTVTVVSFEKETGEFLPKYRFPATKLNQNKFKTVIKNSKEQSKSIIFGESIKELINESNNIDKELKDVYNLITSELKDNIFVYSNRMSGLINTNMDFPIPLYFYYELPDRNQTFGVFPLPTKSSAKLSSKELNVAKHVLEQINIVIPKIIPKLSINIKELSKQLDDDGEELHVVEVVSEREGRVIPFRSESDGIKKIVSILSALINAYSSPRAIVAIDELDSGIYEFLLGELLEVFSRGARGQIIFTSHNLRPLEILDKENIIFTTVNPENRYTRKTDIKPSNNLRDVYLRNIQVLEGEDSLYKPTNTFEIQKAFRKARRMNFESESYTKGEL